MSFVLDFCAFGFDGSEEGLGVVRAHAGDGAAKPVDENMVGDRGAVALVDDACGVAQKAGSVGILLAKFAQVAALGQGPEHHGLDAEIAPSENFAFGQALCGVAADAAFVGGVPEILVGELDAFGG